MPIWMLYGATGYTGVLIAEEALRRGHRPVLAGRSEQKVRALADRLGLDQIVVRSVDQLGDALNGVDLVLNAAGPFSLTADPIVRACLSARVHYLDITGEVPVLERTWTYDEAARQAGIALIPGVGFDVVPTDCMAKYVADQVPGATNLEIAFYAPITFNHASRGTIRSGLQPVIVGWVRRDGKLVPHPIGTAGKTIQFSSGDIFALPIPWGDLVTAYRTTGIPNITTYMASKTRLFRSVRVMMPVVQTVLKIPALQRLAMTMVNLLPEGPTPEQREHGSCFVWTRASNGKTAEAWLETAEGYRFTALSAVRAVEKVLETKPPAGFLSPALAFGTDFVLEIEGSKRFDSLPE